jgi:FkbM family methyltransferase
MNVDGEKEVGRGAAPAGFKARAGAALDRLVPLVMRALPRRVLFSIVKTMPQPALVYGVKAREPLPRIELKNSIDVVERLDYARSDIFLHVDSELEHSLRLRSCEKEPDTVEWIETFVKQGDVLYDVGANVGAYSLVAAKFHGGRVRAYAFEPAFVNFTQLCRNVFLNGCEGVVVPLQLALSDETKLDGFNYRSLIPGAALHTFGEAVDDEGKVFEPEFRQPVLSYRVDDLTEQFRLPEPNHMKIDVDGIELAVLRGADRVLRGRALRSIIVEVRQDYNGESVAEFLKERGFSLHSKHERWAAGLFNYVFTRDPS